RGGDVHGLLCPYGGPGDRLWVRETWAGDDCCGYVYRADHPNADLKRGDLDDGDQSIRRWRPAIHMPHAASRITLDVLSVRVERLQQITEDDARAEGVLSPAELSVCKLEGPLPWGRDAFQRLWDAINGKRALWASNPWVWCIEFRRLR